MENKDIIVREIIIDETEIIEDAIMPALGVICGASCVGAICGTAC